jgi:hypothetical protein
LDTLLDTSHLGPTLHIKIRYVIFPLILFRVEIIEKLDCMLSKRATRPYIYEYKCGCVRTHLCIDPSGRQQSLVIRDSPPAIRDSSPAMRRQDLSCNTFIAPPPPQSSQPPAKRLKDGTCPSGGRSRRVHMFKMSLYGRHPSRVNGVQFMKFIGWIMPYSNRLHTN